MVWDKLEILYALVQHDQITADVDEDEQDRMGSALSQLRNKRQLLAAVTGIMGLTSFGTSMYSIGLVEDSEGQPWGTGTENRIPESSDSRAVPPNLQHHPGNKKVR